MKDLALNFPRLEEQNKFTMCNIDTYRTKRFKEEKNLLLEVAEITGPGLISI